MHTSDCGNGAITEIKDCGMERQSANTICGKRRKRKIKKKKGAKEKNGTRGKRARGL